MSQTNLEREQYEARRKWQLDHNSYLSQARREGIEEGLEKGLENGREEGREEGLKLGIIRAIHTCERLLGRPQTPSEDLMRSSVGELGQLSERLEEALARK